MICSKTEGGQQAFKTRSALFSMRQRSAYLLFDGDNSCAQVLDMTSGLGISQVDIDYLLEQGFLQVVTPAPAVTLVFTPSTRTPQERYVTALPLATKVTASLGLRGFRLNLAVEGASGYEDLLSLLPKIQDAAGRGKCLALEQALKG